MTYDLLEDPLLEPLPVRDGYKWLGPVILLKKIGQGGMGAVYKGRHVRLNIVVAAKVMYQPVGMSPEKKSNYIKRFVREAQTAAAIIHQNLVHVSDINVENGLHYLIMEYVDGESAASVLERVGKLTGRSAAIIGLGACEGIAEAHKRHIVHRDVKPENILVTKNGAIKVTDLGLVTAAGARELTNRNITRENVIVGTPVYMAPEQTRNGAPIGPPADVWSMGVTLFELTTGEVPFDSEDMTDLINMIRNDPPPRSLEELAPDLPEPFVEIIHRAMKKDPEDRFASCSEMGSALMQFLFSWESMQQELLELLESSDKPASVKGSQDGESRQISGTSPDDSPAEFD